MFCIDKHLRILRAPFFGYLLNSLLLSSKRLPLTLDEIASKIETRQMTAMFLSDVTDAKTVIEASRNESAEFEHLYRAITSNRPVYLDSPEFPNKTRIFTHALEHLHLVYFTILEDILEEINSIGNGKGI
jgi:hypothetical protein